MKNIKFDKCLNSLLSILDISINRLAKSINVDSSLINRWINGKRIPSYSTNYIENISEFISKNIQNSFQIQRLNDLFSTVCEETVEEYNIKDKIKKLLSESQGYSIECKRIEAVKNKEQVNESINSNKINIENDINIMAKNDYVHSINLSTEDTIIIGFKNILNTAISLLDAAANNKCSNNSMIYITYNTDFYSGDFYTNFINFRNAALKVIENGWNIILLLKLDNNISRSLRLIKFVQPLIKTGKFFPHYFKKYDATNTGKEIFIIPEIGALLSLPNMPYSGADCAFYFKCKAAIDILKSYFNVLITTLAKPLIKYYTVNNRNDYYDFLYENEEHIGNQFIYKLGFSNYTIPERIYIKLLAKKNLSHDSIQKELEFYSKRTIAFNSNIQNFNYKDICSIEAFNDLIKHRKVCFYCLTGMEIIEMEVEDIIEHLENIIILLERYNNYNIAFIEQNSNSTFLSESFYLIVKERHSVMFEVYKPTKCIPEVRLSIKEPMMVNAFEEHYKEIWEQIAPVNKDKIEVIKLIKNQINILENSFMNEIKN